MRLLFGKTQIFISISNASRLAVPNLRNMSKSESKSEIYDLIVIGGGSGGLACAKEAALFNKKVVVLDYVEPSPQGTTWGLGGTCVNVGCIPKKMMHHIAQMKTIIDRKHFVGWGSETDKSPSMNWQVMSSKVQNYVRSLNWGHRVALRENKVNFMNCKGKFKDKNTVLATDKKGEVTELKGRFIVIAVGGRPNYPNIPGAKEYGITSDDLFWLSKSPGKTLVVGASYVALECAGFLHAFQCPTTVMMRSIPLRGFDQQMAEYVVNCMSKEHNIRFLKNVVPTAVLKDEKYPNKFRVTFQKSDKTESSDVFDTVLFAIGRHPLTDELNLKAANVQVNPETKKIISRKAAPIEQTSQDNIFAIGDVLQDGVELTPVAIKSGKLLARRLFNGEKVQMDYNTVATTVFTPIEYACCGLTEEQVVKSIGQNNTEVYHCFYRDLQETTLDIAIHGRCYIKMICNKANKDRVLGLHILGPNAGEIIQGYAVAIKLGVTFNDISSTIGVHPTSAEEVVKLNISKRSGKDPRLTGC